MALYMDYSTRIYNVYLRYLAPEDMHVYSIDEVFMDVTHYLGMYQMTARELVCKNDLRCNERDRDHGNCRNRNQSLSV